MPTKEAILQTVVSGLMALPEDKSAGGSTPVSATLEAIGNPLSVASSCVGKYVIVRSRIEGVNAGLVMDADGTGVVLEGARRLYYHRPEDLDTSWYEGVAISGLAADSKVSAPVTKVIIEDYSMTICSEAARESITGFATSAQE